MPDHILPPIKLDTTNLPYKKYNKKYKNDISILNNVIDKYPEPDKIKIKNIYNYIIECFIHNFFLKINADDNIVNHPVYLFLDKLTNNTHTINNTLKNINLNTNHLCRIYLNIEILKKYFIKLLENLDNFFDIYSNDNELIYDDIPTINGQACSLDATSNAARDRAAAAAEQPKEAECEQRVAAAEQAKEAECKQRVAAARAEAGAEAEAKAQVEIGKARAVADAEKAAAEAARAEAEAAAASVKAAEKARAEASAGDVAALQARLEAAEAARATAEAAAQTKVEAATARAQAAEVEKEKAVTEARAAARAAEESAAAKVRVAEAEKAKAEAAAAATAQAAAAVKEVTAKEVAAAKEAECVQRVADAEKAAKVERENELQRQKSELAAEIEKAMEEVAAARADGEAKAKADAAKAAEVEEERAAAAEVDREKERLRLKNELTAANEKARAAEENAKKADAKAAVANEKAREATREVRVANEKAREATREVREVRAERASVARVRGARGGAGDSKKDSGNNYEPPDFVLITQNYNKLKNKERLHKIIISELIKVLTPNFSKFNYDFNGTTQKITCELNTGYMQELYDKLTYNNYDEYAGLNINKILYDIFPVQDKISETMRERMINQMEKIDKLIDEYQTPQDPSGNKFTGEMNKILGKKNIFKIEDGNITFSVAYENDK